MQSMTPEQALEFLDQIVQQVAMNREQHVRAQMAVRVLLQAIQSPPEPERAPREYEHKDE